MSAVPAPLPAGNLTSVLKELSNVFDSAAATVTGSGCSPVRACLLKGLGVALAAELEHVKTLLFAGTSVAFAPAAEDATDRVNFEHLCASLTLKYPGIQTEFAGLTGTIPEQRGTVLAAVRSRIAAEAALTEQLCADAGYDGDDVAVSPPDARMPRKLEHLKAGLAEVKEVSRELLQRLATQEEETIATAEVAEKFL